MNVRASAYKYGLAHGCTAPLITASAGAVFSRQIAIARRRRSQNNSISGWKKKIIRL
jgi:hypothetical protein